MRAKKTWTVGLVLLLAAVAIVIYLRARHPATPRPAPTVSTPVQSSHPASSATPPPLATSSATSTYQNVRFNFSVAYPAQLLTAGQEPDNGDGVQFAPKSGDADIRAWGEYNANDDSPAALLRIDLQSDCVKDKVSYQVSKPKVVAYSCLNSHGRIVYQKVIIRDDTLATVRFEYDASEQATWAPTIKQMADSLQLGPAPTYEEAH